ncbi:MAG: TetR/AcrR family transcriptional regulator C-terminal domain-containing protein [Lachnospiraceae bacterium]|nr:TetR/AcrR family transcriptional regulator C-terminal domain-containing protein [Lachnospiraceae bacterium]
MDNKKDLTKELLAHCFRELLTTTPFDKITIKTITDRAGLIRPTFYKHFQDKYEVLEWIFRTNVTDAVDLLLENHMEKDSIVIFCRSIDKDKKFYRRALLMDPGPNSFESILTRYIYEALLSLGSRLQFKGSKSNPYLTAELCAEFYTSGLVQLIKHWITSDAEISPEDVAGAIQLLLTNSVPDLVNLS